MSSADSSPPTAASRPSRPWAATVVVVVAGTLVATAVALATYASGFQYGGNSPMLVLLLAVAVPVASWSAVALARAGRGSAARWVMALTAVSFAYLALTAASAEYAWAGGHRDVAARALATVHAAGYIMPVALTQSCMVAAAIALGASGGIVRRLPAGIAAYGAGFAALTMLTLPVGEPYGWVQPPWPSAGAQELTGWLALPWVLSVLAGPFVLWRWLPRFAAPVRHRALALAVVAVVPVVTILFCVLSGLLANAFGVLTATTGEWGLAAAFGVPLVVCPAGLAAALAPDGTAGRLLRRATPAALGAVLTVVIGLCFAILVVAAGAMLGAQFGPAALVPGVAATAVAAFAVTPVRRRLVRKLLLRADPVRATAARLMRGHDGGVGPAEAAQSVLREALGDPSAVLLLRLPDGRGWVTAEGVPHDAVAVQGMPIGDGPEAYLMHSGTDVSAAGAVAEVHPLIERAVLEAAIRDQAAQLESARERAREAAAAERRRLERDLHDGVQGRLLALALDLRMAQRELTDGQAQLVLADATDALAAAIDELRTLASGNAPELLSRDGLSAALQELARRIPVPIALAVAQQRLPPDVETVAYLAVCEAVTNALKHSAATSIAVTVEVNAGHAVVRVEDDGSGGADLRLGSGLRGLSERVGAAGGRLMVADRQPRGTSVEAILPCA